MRLAPGEFARPESDRETWSARVLFLDRVARLVPAVLTDLGLHVLPAYRRVVATLADPAGTSARRPEFHWNEESSPRDLSPTPEERELELALLAWADRYHLCESWVLNTALQTLRWWEGTGRLGWVHLGRGAGLPPGTIPRFQFEQPAWEVDWETKDQFMRRISWAFRLALKRYLKEIEATAAERQWRRIGEKRAHRKGTENSERTPEEHLRRHFDWLVMWQVGGQTQVELAERARVDTKAVAHAIKATAKLIGLRRRSI
jgi:hypothetical protein